MGVGVPEPACGAVVDERSPALGLDSPQAWPWGLEAKGAHGPALNVHCSHICLSACLLTVLASTCVERGTWR